MVTLAKHTFVSILDAHSWKTNRRLETTRHPPWVQIIPHHRIISSFPNLSVARGYQNDRRNLRWCQANDAQRLRQQLQRWNDGVQQKCRHIQTAVVRNHFVPCTLDWAKEVWTNWVELCSLIWLFKWRLDCNSRPIEHYDQWVRRWCTWIQSININSIGH